MVASARKINVDESHYQPYRSPRDRDDASALARLRFAFRRGTASGDRKQKPRSLQRCVAWMRPRSVLARAGASGYWRRPRVSSGSCGCRSSRRSRTPATRRSCTPTFRAFSCAGTMRATPAAARACSSAALDGVPHVSRRQRVPLADRATAGRSTNATAFGRACDPHQ